MHQLNPDGSMIQQQNAMNYGAIHDGHTVKLSDVPTHWDVSFEDDFRNADSVFPKLLKLLQQLPYNEYRPQTEITDRFLGVAVPKEIILTIQECILSLVVRSPKYRNHLHQFNVAIHGRDGRTVEKTEKKLINLNLRHAFDNLRKSMGGRGKFALLFSKKEFIFGDGFYSNLSSTSQIPPNAFALVPLLPNLAIIYHSPTSYVSDPQLVTIELNAEETKSINDATMIYSKNCVFYRSEQPDINVSFRAREHHSIDGFSPYLNSFLETLALTRFSTIEPPQPWKA